MSLPDAMRNHPYIFATEEVALLESSQVIGNMPEILQDIAQELENMQYNKQKITKAVIYPLILIFFTIIAVVILLIYVVPTIVSLFPSEAELPALTRFMLSASSFLQYTRWIWPLVVL
jgi:type IV pilus assembly protein PilC